MSFPLVRDRNGLVQVVAADGFRQVLDNRGFTEIHTPKQAFRLGMPPHGGFAIGLERRTAQLARLDNIRAATLFPRGRHRLRP